MLSPVGNVKLGLLRLCIGYFLFFFTAVSKASPVQRSFSVPQPRQELVLQDKPILEDPIIETNKNILRSLTPDHSFLIDGDIIMSSSRSAIADDLLKWPKSDDGYVRVPYVFADDYPPECLAKFNEAFQDFQKYTCVHFVPMQDQSDFLSIHQLNGCYSNVGRRGGMQIVSLDLKCLQLGKGTIIHELTHALGFWHEQARSDRDRFVTISWANIWTGFENNFMLVGDSRNLVEYDYGSVMHYSRRAFSKDGKDTIIPTQTAEIGQRLGMSPLDIKKINALYQCAPGKYQPVSSDPQELNVQSPNPVVPSKPVLSTAASKTAALLPAGPQKLVRSLESFSCDFERGLCGWTLSGDAFNWTIHSGPVLTVGTGPSHDFTLGHCNASREGNYLYLDASYPNKTAVLISPMLHGPQCLSFMYHMYGQNMGSIAVYKRLDNSTEPDELLWSEKGNKGLLWLYSSVQITALDSARYQLLFKGTTGSGYLSDAALDDIHIQKECYTYNEMMICTATTLS